MGVLEFFSTLVRTDITSSAIKKNFKEKLKIDYLMIDFNSIIHVASQNIVSEINSFMRTILKNLYTGHSVGLVRLTELFTKYKMTNIQSKIKPGTEPNIVIDLFKSHFDDAYLDKLIIGRVISTILHILKTHCVDKQIQMLYLAIDGVPSKGKLIEQRQRKFMGYIIEKYKEKILESYKEYLLKQPDNIYLMEKFQIKWPKGKIAPGTSFMVKLSSYLHSDRIQLKLTEGRPQMRIVISDFSEIGEGEKKIINYINKYIKEPASIMIHSPDADMILLCMLIPIKTIYYLQFHAQELWYNLIDIHTLKNNIGFYINNHPKYAKAHFDTNRINCDMVFLSTLFGNDFVPKIETISVKSGFQSIMNAYLETLLELKDNYLVNSTNNKYRINFTFFKLILHKLLPIENDFIKHNDLYNRYIKIGLIKSVFDYMEITSENLVSTLNGFRSEYENLKHLIKNNQNTHYFETHTEFMDSLKKCIQIKVDDQTANVTYLNNKQLIDLLKTNFKATKDFPRLMINLDTYSTSITDKHEIMLIKKKELGLGRIMNAYEKEVYKFNETLDNYQTKFNATPLQLTQNKINTYYEEYFGVKLSESNSVMADYLEGLLWVFSYYYNDSTYINTWYYQYERSPLLRHLVAYIDTISEDDFVAVTNNLSTYQVKNLKLYFTPVEQLIYVSPMVPDTIKLLPLNYRKMIKSQKLSSFFIDVDKLVDKLWKEPISTEIDCHSISYLNKCLMKSIYRPTVTNDKNFLKEIRQVKPSETSARRNRSEYPPY